MECKQTIVNPLTERCITVGGRTYKTLVKNGQITDNKAVKEVVRETIKAQKSPVKKAGKKSPKQSPVKKGKKTASPENRMRKSKKEVSAEKAKTPSPVKRGRGRKAASPNRKK